MKKTLFISALISLLCLMTVAVQAGGCKLTVESVTVDSTAETAEVNVSLSGNPGIMGMLLTLSYDDGLTLIDMSKQSALGTLVFTEPGAFTNPCRILWDGQDADSSNGAILKLTFRLPEAASGIYNVSLSYNEGGIYDADFNDVMPETVNGKITVGDSEGIVYGDILGDGEVSISDAIYTLQLLSNGDFSNLPKNRRVAADVNGDNKIDVSDVILILQYLASPDRPLGPDN